MLTTFVYVDGGDLWLSPPPPQQNFENNLNSNWLHFIWRVIDYTQLKRMTGFETL